MTGKTFAIGAMCCALLVLRTKADDAAPAAPGVTPITLHLSQAMPQDVFDELSKQGHVKFVTNGNLWDQAGMQAVNDVNLTGIPFWSAVNQVCGLWNIDVQEDNRGLGGDANRVMLSADYGDQKRLKLPTFEQDGFLVQATTLNRDQSVSYTDPRQSNNSCFIQLKVFTDPAMHMMPISQNPTVQVAEDDAGHSMVPKNNRNNYFSGGMQRQSMMFDCNLPLSFPENHGKKIADLKFTLSLQGSDTMDDLTVDKPLEAKEKSKDFGTIHVVFHSLKKNDGGNYALSVGIGGARQQSNIGWQLVQTAKLLDEKGHSFEFAGGGGGGRRRGSALAEYTINFRADSDGMGGNTAGDPAKWVMSLPSNPHTISLPVEFKDLPLPE